MKKFLFYIILLSFLGCKKESIPNTKLRIEFLEYNLSDNEFTDVYGEHPSGTVYQHTNVGDKINGTIIKGKINGKWCYWYPNGKIKEITFFKNGIFDGKTQLWNKDGLLLEEGTFRNGKRVGTWKFLCNGSLKTHTY